MSQVPVWRIERIEGVGEEAAEKTRQALGAVKTAVEQRVNGARQRLYDLLWKNPTAYQVGVEWATGLGPRDRQFGAGDRMLEELRRAPELEAQRAHIRAQLAVGGATETPVRFGRSLGAEGRAAFYAGFTEDVAGRNPTRALLGSFDGSAQVLSVDRAKGEAVVEFHVTNSSSASSGTRLPPPYGYEYRTDGTSRPSAQEMIGREAGPVLHAVAVDAPLTFAENVAAGHGVSASANTALGEMRAAAPHVQAARDAVPKSVLAENPLGAHGPLSTVSQTFHWRETVHFGAVEAKK